MEVVEVIEAVRRRRPRWNVSDNINEVEEEGESYYACTTRCQRPRHVFGTRNTFNRNAEICILQGLS